MGEWLPILSESFPSHRFHAGIYRVTYLSGYLWSLFFPFYFYTYTFPLHFLAYHVPINFRVMRTVTICTLHPCSIQRYRPTSLNLTRSMRTRSIRTQVPVFQGIITRALIFFYRHLIRFQFQGALNKINFSTQC